MCNTRRGSLMIYNSKRCKCKQQKAVSKAEVQSDKGDEEAVCVDVCRRKRREEDEWRGVYMASGCVDAAGLITQQSRASRDTGL